MIASGITVRRNRLSELVAGAISGTTGTIASIGGPPLALHYRNDSGPTMRASLSAIFAAGITMILAARALSGHVTGTDLVVAVRLAPVVWLGYLVVRRLHDRVEGTPLRMVTLTLCATAAVGLLVRTMAG